MFSDNAEPAVSELAFCTAPLRQLSSKFRHYTVNTLNIRYRCSVRVARRCVMAEHEPAVMKLCFTVPVNDLYMTAVSKNLLVFPSDVLIR